MLRAQRNEYFLYSEIKSKTKYYYIVSQKFDVDTRI